MRYFSSVAPAVNLQSPINNAVTTLTVSSSTGYPTSYPFTIAVGYGTATEELMDVTAAAANTFTVVRAVDGTAAASHGAGEEIRHVTSARDSREFQEHQAADSNVHGLTGGAEVVGTSSNQILSNKTIVAPNVSDPVLSGNTQINGPVKGGVSIEGDVAGEVTLKVKEFTGQTQDILQVLSESGTVLFSVNDYPVAGPPTVATNARMSVNGPTGQGPAEWRVNNVLLAYLNSVGYFVSAGVASTSTADITAAAGFTVDQLSSIKKAGIITFTVRLIRTGGTITAGPTGNIPETPACTLGVNIRPHSALSASPLIVNAYGTNGTADGVLTLNPATGEIALSTLSPGASIINGNSVDFTFTYPITF